MKTMFLEVPLSKFKFPERIKVLGVASNYGLELEQIFKSNPIKAKCNIEILDLSQDAIKKGEKCYPEFKFHQGAMEDSPLLTSAYDIYINLRSIHSSGANYQLALTECFRILKPGGIAIISVSNGYLTPKKPDSNEFFEVKGLYDNRTESFSKHRPLQLARKIWSKLNDYGFSDIGICFGNTEIFVWAKR